VQVPLAHISDTQGSEDLKRIIRENKNGKKKKEIKEK
jgi:hypothetical protein